MITTELVTKVTYHCDVHNCLNSFSTTETYKVSPNGWTTTNYTMELADEPPRLHVLHFCRQHGLRDWL